MKEAPSGRVRVDYLVLARDRHDAVGQPVDDRLELLELRFARGVDHDLPSESVACIITITP